MQKENRWQFVKVAYVHKIRGAYWLVRCSCSLQTEKVVQAYAVKNNLSCSCGCILSEINKKRGTHNKTRTPEYVAWSKMLMRCYNPKDREYHRYGGRGIQVCEEWRRNFAEFLAYVGPRPEQTKPRQWSLDRIDTNKGYEPGNVRWATAQEQARNRRSNKKLTINGQTRTAAEWADFVNLPQCLIILRLHRGWSPERALFEPINTRRAAAKRKAV